MRPRTRDMLLSLLLLVIFAGGLAIIYRQSRPVPEPPPVQKTVRYVDESKSPAGIQNFPVKRNGVHSVDEIRRLIEQHPGIYPDLDVDSLRPVITSGGFYAYSQYFRNGKMLWTKHPTWIAAGTLLFCDKYGHCINSICANELSLSPREPVNESLEPVAGEPIPIDQVPPVVDLPPTVSGIPLDVNGEPVIPPTGGGSPLPPGTFFCCAGGGGGNHPPTQVPEPGTWMLLVAGILFVLYFKKRYGSRS